MLSSCSNIWFWCWRYWIKRYIKCFAQIFIRKSQRIIFQRISCFSHAKRRLNLYNMSNWTWLIRCSLNSMWPLFLRTLFEKNNKYQPKLPSLQKPSFHDGLYQKIWLRNNIIDQRSDIKLKNDGNSKNCLINMGERIKMRNIHAMDKNNRNSLSKNDAKGHWILNNFGWYDCR